MRLTDREEKLVSLVIGVALIAASLQWSVFPAIKKVWSLRTEIQRNKQSLEQLSQIRDPEAIIRQSFKKEILPKKSMPSLPFEKLSQQIKLAGLTLQSMEWSSAEAKSQLALHVQGSFSGLLTYLTDSSKESPGIVPVLMNMHPSRSDKPHTLDITLMLR